MDSEESPADAHAPVIVDDGPHRVMAIIAGGYGKSVAAQIMAALATDGIAITKTSDTEITVITYDEFTDIPRELFDAGDIVRETELLEIRRSLMPEPMPIIELEKPHYHPTSPKQSRFRERYPRHSGGKKGKRRGR